MPPASKARKGLRRLTEPHQLGHVPRRNDQLTQSSNYRSTAPHPCSAQGLREHVPSPSAAKAALSLIVTEESPVSHPNPLPFLCVAPYPKAAAPQASSSASSQAGLAGRSCRAGSPRRKAPSKGSPADGPHMQHVAAAAGNRGSSGLKRDCQSLTLQAAVFHDTMHEDRAVRSRRERSLS